jgi:hypothetical protein
VSVREFTYDFAFVLPDPYKRKHFGRATTQAKTPPRRPPAPPPLVARAGPSARCELSWVSVSQSRAIVSHRQLVRWPVRALQVGLCWASIRSLLRGWRLPPRSIYCCSVAGGRALQACSARSASHPRMRCCWTWRRPAGTARAAAAAAAAREAVAGGGRARASRPSNRSGSLRRSWRTRRRRRCAPSRRSDGRRPTASTGPRRRSRRIIPRRLRRLPLAPTPSRPRRRRRATSSRSRTSPPRRRQVGARGCSRCGSNSRLLARHSQLRHSSSRSLISSLRSARASK